MNIVILIEDMPTEQRNHLARKWLKKTLLYIMSRDFERARNCVNGGLLCEPSGSIHDSLMKYKRMLNLIV